MSGQLNLKVSLLYRYTFLCSVLSQTPWQCLTSLKATRGLIGVKRADLWRSKNAHDPFGGAI